MARLTPYDARAILNRTHTAGVDFHILPADRVDALLAEADTLSYRKPRNANGSRARYFHAYLTRTAARREH